MTAKAAYSHIIIAVTGVTTNRAVKKLKYRNTEEKRIQIVENNVNGNSRTEDC